MKFYKKRYDYDEIPVEDIRLGKYPIVPNYLIPTSRTIDLATRGSP